MSFLAAWHSPAPIDHTEINRPYQMARALIALCVGGLAVLAILQGDGGWPYLLIPAALAAAHAGWQLANPGPAPLGSLLVDVTLFSFVALALGDLPRAAATAVAYVVAAALLLLPLANAAVVLAYATVWAVVVSRLAPVTDIRSLPAVDGSGFDLVAGLLIMLVLAGLLVTASRALRTLRRRQEDTLRAERAAGRLKDEFVSMVSHEFRTPLTSIAGFVESLRESWERLSADEIEDFLGIVHGETLHLSHLVEDILVIPRLEAGILPFAPESFALGPVARQVVDVVFPDRTWEVDVSIPGRVYVHADPRRVAQVLRNLLENARKYGGDQILVEGEQRDATYQVVVADNGAGIPAHSREQIFEPFEQVGKGDAWADRGIGLGLPIAARLVRAMGGDLWYEGRFPTGSRFCFTLPSGSPPPQTGPRPGGHGELSDRDQRS